MAAMAPVKLSTLNTGVLITSSATIGIDTTLSPEGFIRPQTVSYVNRSGGIALGYDRLTMSVRPPTKESRVYKVSAKFFQPVLETIDPAVGIFGPQLGYELQAHIDLLIPERSTLLDRQKFLSRILSLFGTTINASDALPTDLVGSPVVDAVLNFEMPY